ncbi:ABC transporter permease subunit [Proteiniclasticum sp. C24MP]|uniref:ABC transporter permease subunit n=1 Tax=Proteiniclasticum sp. C24MP TaxID=3374101 RepID=UPI003754377B
MNIYKRELRSEAKGIFFWILGTGFVLFVSMSEFLLITDSGIDITDFMDAMPRSLMVLFGMNDLDMGTSLGYHGIMMYYVILAGILYAAMLGVRIISKEELLKTSEFLLTKPRSRRRILTFKILAGITLVSLFTLAVYLSSILSLEVFGGSAPYQSVLLKEVLSLFLLMLLYFSLGILSASLIAKPRLASSLILSMVFATFLLGVFHDLLDSPMILRLLTPFRYFPLVDLVEKNTLSTVFALLTVLLIMAAGFLSFRSYEKRDMNI